MLPRARSRGIAGGRPLLYVLIVTKPTNLEQHGDVVRSMIRLGRSSAELQKELETAHSEHYACLDLLKRSLEQEGIAFEEVSRANLPPLGLPFDGIFTVGGDGTLLSASRLVLDHSPLIGIRSSSSSVGYLCAAGADGLLALVQAFKAGSLKYDEISRLSASIHYAEDKLHMSTAPILNDFLFANSNPAATTRYCLNLGTQREFHKSSGIWISTSLGSTAAILAAGGKAMERGDGRFQFVVRELYRGEQGPLSLTHGFFDPDQNSFVIENRSEFAMLALDGQRETVALRYGDLVSFIRAPSVKVARPLI